MQHTVRLAMLAASVASMTCLASIASAAPRSAQSMACSKEADTEGLHGSARTHFRATCMKGAMGINKPTASTAPTREAQAITKPSGADRNVRAKQCSDEADKRGLTVKARDAFKLECLATAAPVATTGTPGRPTAPSKAIPKLGTQTSTSSAPPR